MIDTVRQDLNLAVRSLWREPGVTLVALASLAIGIAANATVFSLVQAVEFPRLPYPDASRIVFIESRNLPRDLSELPISAPDALDLAAVARTIDTPALTVDDSATIREAATPAHWSGRQVTPAFFSVLQMAAARGRVLSAGDERQAIVLADRFWQRELGSDPAVVGRVIHVNGEPRTVVGVMPPRFDLDADYWTPLEPATTAAATRDDRRFTLFARLARNATMADATREAADISSRLSADHPATNTGWQMFPTLLVRMHGQDSHGAFLMMQAAVAFVLLIACANIANILLARGTRRAHDMAVRIALGASRGRLVRQLLTESLLLALVGGAAGALLTLWGIRLARSLYNFPDVIDPTLNPIVIAFTALVSITTGIVCGIIPAVRASRVAPHASLQADGGRGGAERAGRAALRATLVAVQVASAVVLATGTALLVQTLINRAHVDLGFNPSGAIRADLTFSGAQYASADSRRIAADGFFDRLRTDPAVVAAGGQGWALSRGVGSHLQITLPTRADATVTTGGPNAIEAVTPEYFAAMAVPVKQGRTFSSTDHSGAPLVAIINEEFARTTWPDRSPLGDVVRLGTVAENAPQVTIVGVVGSIRRSAMHGSVLPRLYVAFDQFPSPSLAVVVRARGDVAPAQSAMQAALRQTDATLVLDEVRTVEADVARFIEPVRFITVLFTMFGVTGVLLAALGVFGMMSYAVSQRRREMAVRTALGARRADILRLVLGNGLRITLAGLGAGVAVAILAGRALASFLFGVSPVDPPTLMGVALVLAVVSLAACYRPARLAASADPMTVLRRD